MSEQPYFAADDLRRVIEVGLPRGEHLLAPDERATIARIAAIPDPELDSWARLSKRRHPVQRRSEVDACDSLLAHGLVHPAAHAAAVQRLTVPELQAYLRAQGIRVRRSARRPTLLQAALDAPEGPLPQPFVEVGAQRLWQRAWRFFTLRAFPDPDLPVLERLGIRTWPSYEPTPGALLWQDRGAMLAWEGLLDGLVDADAERLVQAAHDPAAAAPGRLDLRRTLRRRLLERGTDLEADDVDAARTCYRALLHEPDRYAHRARLRLALLHERAGAPDRGLALLAEARPHTRGWRRMALNRTARRLARVCRQGWAPDRPLPVVRERRVPLPSSPTNGPRPTFQGLVVEHAMIQRLAGLGRVALHTEGGLWRHLFAMVFAPLCYFAPVNGALPAPFLAGPLDLGTPLFAARRAGPIAETWERVRRGGAPELVRETHARFADTHLAGARWERTADEDATLTAAIGPAVLERILGTLLERGLRAARGLPDLLVLPGPAVRLPGAHPGRLGSSLCFAELKTPNDTLSDPQRWWLARLHDVARVEVWQVPPERHTRVR